jgi:hypothetical protein
MKSQAMAATTTTTTNSQLPKKARQMARRKEGDDLHSKLVLARFNISAHLM